MQNQIQNQTPTLNEFLNHLRTESKPFVLKKNGQPPEWKDADLHQSFADRDIELYALLGLVDTVKAPQRSRILFTLLARSRAGMKPELRQQLDRIANVLLAIVHPDDVLTVFLALRRVRANHKHVTRAILNYICQHPQFEDLALRRRPAVVDAIEHALGKNVTRGVIKQLALAGENTLALPRPLRQLKKQLAPIQTILPHLYKPPVGIGFVPAVGDICYVQTHAECVEKIDKNDERPQTVTATNRGEISAHLVHLYRGGYSQQLQEAADLAVLEATAMLPVFSGKVAIVLDVSASTRSYGDREFCSLSQSIALVRVLEKCCQHVKVYHVGSAGYSELPMPEGDTDLAAALLDALEDAPDVVAIVSDGYENVYPGDLAKIAVSLPQLKIHTPVVFCHSKFTNLDDLRMRRPATELPQFEFWHQNEFPDLLLSLFSRVTGTSGEQFIREFLFRKLKSMEQELMLWTASN